MNATGIWLMAIAILVIVLVAVLLVFLVVYLIWGRRSNRPKVPWTAAPPTMRFDDPGQAYTQAPPAPYSQPGAQPYQPVSPEQVVQPPAPAPEYPPQRIVIPPSPATVQMAPAWLVVNPERRYQLKQGRTQIGRAVGSDVQITDDFTVSPNQASIVESEGVFMLESAGEIPVLLNGNPVKTPTELAPGDVLQFGEMTIMQFVRIQV